jgi:mevalonate kinase
LTDEHFDYCHDNYLYVFLTGEEADYDKLSEEKKAIVDLKKQEAKDFLKTIHTAIVENLKTMFKEKS